jgi:hypothetical protein
MRSNDTALGGDGDSPRLLYAAAAGIGALFAAALTSGALLHGAPPMPARVEAGAPVPAGGSGPARPSAPRLCFHGPGGDLLDLAPAGQPCP